ncbi:MAG: DUF4912 domain-containing protein [Pyrinomonadaceae bacterium]
MATDRVKKGSSERPRTAKTDPFDSVVEQKNVPAASAEKSRSGAKRVKPAGSDGAKAMAVTRLPGPIVSKPASTTADAFAEIATNTPVEDHVELEIPALPVKKSRSSTSKKTATKAPLSTANIETAKKSRSEKASTKTLTKAEPPAVELIPVSGSDALASSDASKEIAATEPKVELSAVFKALADVKLPELKRENRARLQMQSPTRLYFYWSLRQNPWLQLRAVFGPELGSYTLIVKLRNLTAGTEQIHPIETQGEWWFNDVEAGSQYMAEIGFLATNRPYFRVIYSNTVETPRRSPSTHPATESRWTVSATKFAEVLEASGFTRDAVDVTIVGDDRTLAEERTQVAFSQMVGDPRASAAANVPTEDLRYAMLAIAGGAALADLKDRVSPQLYSMLESNAKKLTKSSARRALSRNFDIEGTEWTEHEVGSAVFGASLLNFPKRSEVSRATDTLADIT